jgi:hypothetical protein
MRDPYAHIAGVPLEEALPTIASTACLAAVIVRARLRGLGGWLRRR